MSSILEKLSQQGLTKEHIQRAQARVEGVLKEAEKNPVLRRELLEKLGFSPWETLKTTGRVMGRSVGPILGKSLGAATAGAVMGAGALGAKKGYEAVESSVGKAKAYKEMIDVRPELKDRDPKAVQRAFNSLYRFNPAYARDPLVAGSFVDSVSASERLDLGTVNALVAGRKSMAGPSFEPFRFLPRTDLKVEEKELGG